MAYRFSAIAAAVAMAFPLASYAATSAYSPTGADEIVTDDVNISGAYDIGIYALPGTGVSFTGDTITVNTTPGADWGAGNVGVEVRSNDASASHVVLGSDHSKVSVIVKDTTTDPGEIAVGLWATGATNTTNKEALLTVNGDSLVINGTSVGGAIYGIYAQNRTTTDNDGENAHIIINSKNTVINVSNENPDVTAAGIVVMSQGIVEVNGNLEVNARTAISARGDSTVKINESGKNTVKLNGDIDFNYDAETSGTKVDSNVLVNLSGADSYWIGNSTISYSTGAPVDPSKLEVNKLTIGLSDGAQWTPTVVVEEATRAGESGVFNAPINSLVLNSGVVNINEGVDVKVQSLEGAGGTVNVAVTQVDGAYAAGGSLTVGSASADSSLTVQASGITADDVTNAEEALAALNGAVGGEVQKTNTIAEGDINGAIKQEVAADGSASEVVVEKNTKLDAFGSVNALSAMTLRHEMNSLSKRMGELRDAPAGVGVWARYYGSEMEYGAQDLTSKNNTIQMGSDYTIGDWKVGVAANYTDGESSYDNGSADNKNYGLAVYGTWFVPCGAYVDLIAKYTRMDNDFALNGMNGSYENNAFNVSAETGYRFEFMDGGLFVEPQVGVSYGRIMGDDFTAANGVRIEQDDYDSLIGRVGVRTGFKFPEDKGLIYARVSGVYDFQGELDAVASKDGLKQNITEDLGGAWVEFGVGANFNWTKNTYSYVDVERTNGGDVKENYRFNVGIRHTF